MAAVVFISMGVYKGTIQGPFNESFVTPEAGYSSTVNLVCPPAGSMPLEANQVAVRVFNGTTTPGLAGNTLEDLEGRGFVGLGASNWSRSYDKVARIMFGETGVQKAYTLALQFTDAQLILDTRANATVDVVVGAQFKGIVSPLDPQLDSSVPLSANAPCVPVNQVEPEPAPHNYPKDPLATETSASPSPSASASK